MMSSLQISFFGATDIGRVRTNNEDTFIATYIWDQRHILLAVIDGMGGEEGGEIAAEIARRSIIGYLEEFQNDTVLNLIKRALADANNEIIRKKEGHPLYRRMGCVATAGIIDLDEQTLSMAHVGDTRLYRYSDGELSKLTHDHSLVGYQEEQGILSEEQAMKHPRRSVIERCLGSENHLADDKSFIEAGVFPLIKGETFLFCSDGLSDVLKSAQIADCIETGCSLEGVCLNLIGRANEEGGKDNITVVLARVSESEKPFELRDCKEAGFDEDEDCVDKNVLDNPELNNAGICKSNSKKRISGCKLISSAIALLIVSVAAGFFLGMQFSQSEKKQNLPDKKIEETNILQSQIIEDSVTVINSIDSIII